MKFIMVVLLFVITLTQANATDYLITTGVDGAVDDGNCTLREALLAANTQSAVDQCPAGSSNNVIRLMTISEGYTFDQGEMVVTNPQSLRIVASGSSGIRPVVNMDGGNRFLFTDEAGVFLDISNINFAFGLDETGDGGGVILMNVASGVSNLRLINVGFYNSIAVGAVGGGVYFSGAGNLTMDNVLFQSNRADGGAGLALNLIGSLGFSISSDVEFVNNISNSGGGALNINAVNGQAILQRFNFEENTASGGDDVAGIFMHVQDFSSDPSTIILNDNSVKDNQGAGLYIDNTGGLITINGLVLKDNFKPNGQGTFQAIVNSATEDGRVRIHNPLIYQSDTQQGAGLVLGVDDDSSKVSVRHATIVNHSIGVIGSSTAANPESLELIDSIVYGNLTELLNFDFDVDSLIGVDPLFTDMTNEDFTLTANSPAVDMATEVFGIPVDVAKNPRVYNGAPDLGAYERQGPINVNLTFLGTGLGTVSYEIEGVLVDSCSGDCSFTLQSSETLRLFSTSESGSVFDTWGQECQSAGSSRLCTIGKNGADLNISVQFIDEDEIIFKNSFGGVMP